MARSEYAEQNWEDAETLADSARRRFEALAGAGDQELVGVGQFFSLEGRVQLQRAGQTEWENAHQNIPVFNGDFVRTGRDGNAEILFADGSLYRISPNSLLEIHHEMSQESPGTVKMVVGRINVYTSGAPSTVTTDTAATEIDRDSRVAVDVAADDQKTTRRRVPGLCAGSQQPRRRGGRDRRAGSRRSDGQRRDDRKAADSRTAVPDRTAQQRRIRPREKPMIELAWRGRPRNGTVHLQVSRSKSFDSTQLEVDAPRLAKDKARLRLVSARHLFLESCRPR